MVLHGQVVDIVRQGKNRATELIEDFMIAANEIVARMLEAQRVSSIRRVVRTPERWDRIVALAPSRREHAAGRAGFRGAERVPDRRKAADPDRFADLSLAVIKLMGPGEYVLERPGDVSHRALRAGGGGLHTFHGAKPPLCGSRHAAPGQGGACRPAPPYSDDDLARIAENCTLKENASRKVEREMSKRIAAVAMSGRIGEVFDAVVTGVTPRGTFVRILTPRVEGLLARGQQGADVGDKLRVTLISTDVQHGYIDFARAGDRM